MHHVVALIAKRQGAHALIWFVPIAKCFVPYVQGLIPNHIEPGVSLEAVSLFLGVEVRLSTSYPPQTLP